MIIGYVFSKVAVVSVWMCVSVSDLTRVLTGRGLDIQLEGCWLYLC